MKNAVIKNRSGMLMSKRCSRRIFFFLFLAMFASSVLSMVACGQKSKTTFGGGSRSSSTQGKLTCEQQLKKGQEILVNRPVSVCEEQVSSGGSTLVPVLKTQPSYFKISQARGSSSATSQSPGQTTSQTAGSTPVATSMNLALKVVVDFPVSLEPISISRGMKVLTGRCAPAVQGAFKKSGINLALEFVDAKNWNGRLPQVRAQTKPVPPSQPRPIVTAGRPNQVQVKPGAEAGQVEDAEAAARRKVPVAQAPSSDADAAIKIPRLVLLESLVEASSGASAASSNGPERFEIAFWPRSAPLFLADSKRCEDACADLKLAAANAKCMDSCSAILNDPFCEDVAKWTGLLLGFQDSSSSCQNPDSQNVNSSEDDSLSPSNIMRGHRELAPGVQVVDVNGKLVTPNATVTTSGSGEAKTLAQLIPLQSDKNSFLFSEAMISDSQKQILLQNSCAAANVASAPGRAELKAAAKLKGQIKSQVDSGVDDANASGESAVESEDKGIRDERSSEGEQN